MNINDFGIFIFSITTPFNRMIDLYILKYYFKLLVCSYLNYVEVEIRQEKSK